VGRGYEGQLGGIVVLLGPARLLSTCHTM
jgi:hypothetical protein